MNKLRGTYLAIIYLFLYLPIAVGIVYSFNASKYNFNWKGFTLDWYVRLFNNTELIKAAINSLIVALSSATFATFLGTLTAIALFKYSFPLKNAFYSLLYVVAVSPEIVMGVSLLMLYNILGMPLGFMGLFIAHTTFCLPFAVITILGHISGFDKSIIDAARDLGASEIDVYRKIILPITLPAIIAGWLLSFTISMDDVIVSFFLVSPSFETLPIKVFSMVRLGVKPEVNALFTIMFSLSVIMVIIIRILLSKKGTDIVYGQKQ